MEQSRASGKSGIKIEKGEIGDIQSHEPNALIGLPTVRPFTLSGLQLYIGCNDHYFSQFKKNLDEDEEDFTSVITRIEKTIYTQKFEGAVVGAFNANIIARDLGLSDKTDITSKGEMILPIITVQDTATAEEVKKIINEND